MSTLQSEINNIKSDGYKKNVSDDFNSAYRRGRNVILCKHCKDNNQPLVTIVSNVANLTIWQGNVATNIRQSGKLKEIVGIWQPAIKETLPKKCYNCEKLLFGKYYSCSSCKYVYFCGKECQLRSWTHHKTICTSIATLHFFFFSTT